MSVHDQVLTELRKANELNGRLEKMVAEKSRVSNADQVVKAFLANGGRNPVAGIGFDGINSHMNVVTGFSKRAKGCGMGRFLELVVEADGHNSHVVEKSLNAMDSHRVTKDLTESSGVTGGFTVPPEYRMSLLRLIAAKSRVRELCMPIPMNARELLIPALDHSAAPANGTSGFFGGITGTWTPEGTTGTGTQPSFRQVALKTNELMFTMAASNQLMADNAIALDILLTTLFSDAMAWFIDYFVLRGSGVGQPRGVLGAPCAVAVARQAAAEFGLADAAAMKERLLEGYDEASTMWVMHKSLEPKLITMADSLNGRLVWLNQFPNGPATEGGGAAQRTPLNLLGIPVLFTEKVPQLGTLGDVSLIDFSKVIFGERQAIQIESSQHALFSANQILFRVIARFDSQPWLNAPLIGADGAGTYTMSNVVQLSA